MSRVCRMPPKRRKAPGGAQQKRRVKILCKAFRDARAARWAHGVEEQKSTHGSERDVQMSQTGTSAKPKPVIRPITIEDLVAMIIGVL